MKAFSMLMFCYQTYVAITKLLNPPVVDLTKVNSILLVSIDLEKKMIKQVLYIKYNKILHFEIMEKILFL